jgi:hypothetical protein
MAKTNGKASSKASAQRNGLRLNTPLGLNWLYDAFESKNLRTEKILKKQNLQKLNGQK